MSITETGDYLDFKQCALTCVCIPVVGRRYRLLNDGFNKVWRLASIQVSYLGAMLHAEVWDLVFYVAGGNQSYEHSTHLQCLEHHTSSWAERVKDGSIIVDGECVPPGTVRDWGLAKHNVYVVERELYSEMALLYAQTPPVPPVLSQKKAFLRLQTKKAKMP